jgi:DDE superfamily endonuclease
MAETGQPPPPDAAPTRQLRAFRASFYDCLTRWADALFELSDAVLCSPAPISSVPTLSLEPAFRRSHGSLYKALDRGVIDTDRLRALLVANRPEGWPLIFAVDASSWPRCNAETSPERGFYYSASTHSAGQPIVAGWSYQWITQLDWAMDSWTAPLDALRIPAGGDATTATITQIRRLLALLPVDGPMPMFVFDAGYDAAALSHELTDDRVQVVVRIRDDRVFYTSPPPPAPGRAGRPRRHGQRFGCADDSTSWPEPAQTLTAADPRYGTVHVQAWPGLHPRLGRRGHWTNHDQTPTVTGTVVRVQVAHLPKPTAHAGKTLWLWVASSEPVNIDTAWRAYLRRFDIEHTYRFVKNTLGWTAPAIRTPAQADRWTWLIVATYTQLRLARGLVADNRLPWQRPRAPSKLTPARVRRGFRHLHPQLGTPTSPPKSTTPGPGRPKGTKRAPRTRYPPIKKAA